MERLMMDKPAAGVANPYASRIGRGWMGKLQRGSEALGRGAEWYGTAARLPRLGRALGWGMKGLGPVGMTAATVLPFLLADRFMGGGDETQLADKDKNLDRVGTNPMLDHNAIALREMEERVDEAEMMRFVEEAFGGGNIPGARMVSPWRIV